MITEELARVSELTGVDVIARGGGLLVGGSAIEEPDWENLNFRHAFPSRAHGDQREKLLYKVVQDAGERQPRYTDGQLRNRLESLLPVGDQRAARVVADAMREQYWVAEQQPFLLPYHSALPLSFAHSLGGDPDSGARARYRMFSGAIIPFLCWTGREADRELMADLLAIFNGEDGFTLLDDLLMRAVRDLAGEPGEADPGRLDRRLPADAREALLAGPFCQPALDRFQRDLRTVLGMRLPRRDLIESLNQLLGLHLAIMYYRVATVLGEELDSAVAADAGLAVTGGGCDCHAGLRGCSLAGKLRFRVGTQGYRPVSMKDGCVQSYREVDSRRLLALPASIITANLLHHLWRGVDSGAPGQVRVRALVARLRQDPEFARVFSAGAAGMAVLYRNGRRLPDPVGDAELLPGVHSLRQAVLAAKRGTLKYTSRDVVNQLAMNTSGAGGGLLNRHGTRVTFFELDEAFLFLVAKLICRDTEVPLDEFERELADYGLSPQDAAESARLADALDGMGMLVRYSDSGDSAYVRHTA